MAEILNRFAYAIAAEVDPRAFSEFERQGIAAGSAIKSSFGGIQSVINDALSVPRNAVGSLDLGIEKLRGMERELQAVATASREVAVANIRVSQSQGATNRETADAIVKSSSLALAKEKELAGLRQEILIREQLQAELNKTASATGGLVTGFQNAEKGAGRSRQAFIQSGQQLQDFAIQIQGGQSASVAFAQQASQLGFILSQLDANAKGATGKFAQLGALLSGPFGIPIIFGISAAIALATEAFGANTEAVKATEEAIKSFTNRQLDVSNFIDKTTGSLIEQNSVLRENAILLRQGEADKAKKSVSQLELDAFSAVTKFGKENAVATKPTVSQNARFAGLAITKTGFDPEIDAAVKASNGNAFELQKAIKALNRKDTKNLLGELSNLNSRAIILARESKKLQLESTAIGGGPVDASLFNPKDGKKSKKGPSAETLARQANTLRERGEDASDRIASITGQFNEAPKLVDQTAEALRKLDDLANDFALKKPPNYADLVSQLETARGVVTGFVGKEFDRQLAQGQRGLEIQALVLAGRDDEATALGRINALQERLGDLSAAQRTAVLGQVIAERQVNEALEARQRTVSALTGAVQGVRGSLENLLSGGSAKGFADSLKDQFKTLRGQLLTESIFGSTLRDLEAAAKGQTGLGKFDTQAGRAASSASNLASAFDSAALVIANATSKASDPDFVTKGAPATNSEGEIVVTARRSRDPFFDNIIKKNTEALAGKLDDVFGVRFFNQISGAIGSGLSGFVRAGGVGGALGLIQGIAGKNSKIGGLAGVGLRGAETGFAVAGIGKSFGIKTSRLGGQLGGAAGSASGIPGGELAGSLFGSIVGGLFKKTPKGTVSISNTGSSFSGSGKLRSGLTSTGDSVTDTLNNIAEQLGGSVGAFSTSIRQKKNSFFVGSQKFGSAEEASRAAILQQLQAGVISGIDAGAQRILQAGGDLDRALRQATTFQTAIDRIKESTDPLGAALQKITREFGPLRDALTAGGATAEQFAGLAALETKERKAALESITAGLRAFQRENSFGEASGKSLRDRQAAALAEFNPLEARVKAGDATAFDRFVELGGELRGIFRDIDGSQKPFFDFIDRLQATTNSAIAGQEGIASLNSTAAPVVSAIDKQTQILVNAMSVANDNNAKVFGVLTEISAKLSGGGGGSILRETLNFA